MSPTQSPRQVAPLPITGERTVPDVWHENYWFQRHVAAYAHCATMVRGAEVVDAGCGEGYGTAMLAQVAGRATGIDLVPEVIDHARAAYPAGPDQPIRFLTADICDTGLAEGSVDAVVNLQVIEHLPDVGRFLGEQRRIIREGGRLLVATPNRLTFSPHDHEPLNVFHVEEFAPAELVDRLRGVGGLEVTRLLGLHHGPRIRSIEATTGTPFTELVLQPVETWPPWLASVVRRITPADFTWSDTDLDRSLDLLATCTR